MKSIRRTVIAIGLVILTSRGLNAQELPEHVFAVSPEDEIQDLLFLADARPVLIRLRIRVDGDGHRGRWLEYVHRLHARADADRNGIVTRTESDAAIDRVYQLQSVNTLVLRQIPARRRLLYSPDIVSVDDMAAQMETISQAFRIESQTIPSTSNHEATFRLLDRDGDGHLSREELEAVGSSLARLDLDDDETIGVQEMGAYRNPPPNNVVVRTSAGATAMPPGSGALISATGQKPKDLARLIIGRYKAAAHPAGPARPSPVEAVRDAAKGDAGRDGILRAEEFPIGRESFARMDADGDGAVDLAELERAIADAADLDLIIRLGHREAGRATIERVEGNSGIPPFGTPNFRLVDDLMIIELTSNIIELRAEAEPFDPFAGTRRIFETRFRTADVDKSGDLDKTELRRFPIPAQICELADRDGDGRLTEAEWRIHLDEQAKVIGLRTVLGRTEQGPSFFDLLDENRDGRLGLRELQAAAKRILAEDRDGDGRVSLREFARHHRWTVARGPVATANQPQIIVNQPLVRPVKLAAPEWFLKMDRNRDGDISPREFLGTRSTFVEYDIDRDGLIAPSEASRRP